MTARYFQRADGSVMRLSENASFSDYDNTQPVQVVPESAIVITRGELMGVEHLPFGRVRAYPESAHEEVGTPAWHRAQAREHLSLEEYVREHPPVDAKIAKKAVKELAGALKKNSGAYSASERVDIAQRVISMGWTKP